MSNFSNIADGAAAIDDDQLTHDLMAPLCNIKAYTGELRQVSIDIAVFFTLPILAPDADGDSGCQWQLPAISVGPFNG